MNKLEKEEDAEEKEGVINWRGGGKIRQSERWKEAEAGKSGIRRQILVIFPFLWVDFKGFSYISETI